MEPVRRRRRFTAKDFHGLRRRRRRRNPGSSRECQLGCGWCWSAMVVVTLDGTIGSWKDELDFKLISLYWLAWQWLWRWSRSLRCSDGRGFPGLGGPMRARLDGRNLCQSGQPVARGVMKDKVCTAPSRTFSLQSAERKRSNELKAQI